MYNKSVCVVGAGNWGKNHIRTLHELGFLGGIVESNQETLNRFAEQYPNVKGFLSLNEALREVSFLGFTVATPAETHYQLAKKIIEAGKHVLVEKPFTLQNDHAEELVRLSEKNNVNLMVGHVLLFHPAIIKIKELIQKGRTQPMAHALPLERELFVQLFDTQDQKEGVNAFLEKRKANWVNG